MRMLIPLVCAGLLAGAQANTVKFDKDKSMVCAGVYSKEDWGGSKNPSIKFEITQFENKKWNGKETPRPVSDVDISYIIFEYRDLEFIGRVEGDKVAGGDEDQPNDLVKGANDQAKEDAKKEDEKKEDEKKDDDKKEDEKKDDEKKDDEKKDDEKKDDEKKDEKKDNEKKEGEENTKEKRKDAHAPKRQYICDNDAILHKLCTKDQFGTYLYTPHKNSTIFTAKMDRLGRAQIEYNITRTGYYCVSTVSMHQRHYKGQVSFQNAFGYLSASEVPKLPAYGIMAVLYAVIFALYGFQFWKKRKQNQILPLQRYLLAMLGFLTFDTIVVWSYYDLLNNTPKTTSGFNMFYMIFLSLFNAFKIAGSFYLLLLIALGYGVVVLKLPKSVMFKCKLLAAANFIAAMVYLVSTYYSGSFLSVSKTNDLEDDDLSGWLGLLCYIPIAITITCYYMLVLVSIRKTIQGLSEQRQVIKIQLYNNLFKIIFFSVFLTFAGLGLSSFIYLSMSSTVLMEEHWKGTFFFYDFWPAVVYFLVFMGVAWLWRPTETSYMLAISQQLAADGPEDDEGYQRGHEFELDDLSLMSHSDTEANGANNANYRADSLDLPRDGPKKSVDNPFDDANTVGGSTVAPSSSRRSNDNTLFELGDDESDAESSHADDRLAGGKKSD
ncbi:hypothetical protein DICA4_F24608 [Diutina catenulata]